MFGNEHLSSITCVVHAARTAPCRLLTFQGSTKRAELKGESNKRIRVFSDDEEQRLFATVPQDYPSPILLALHTGMRKGEMLNLKWEGVDLKRKRLTIRESKAGEAHHEPMNEVVIQTLQSLPRMLHNPYVFYGRNCGDRLRNGIKNTDWKRYLKEAKIENFHWHDLRHTFASRLVMKGINLYKLLGHHSLDMTERYAHLAPDFLQNAVDVLAIPAAQVIPELTPAANASNSSSVSSSFQTTRP